MKISHLKLTDGKFADLKSESGQCAALFDDYRNIKKIRVKLFTKAQLLYVKMILFSYPVGVENVPSWRVDQSSNSLIRLRFFDIGPNEEKWNDFPFNSFSGRDIDADSIADGLCWLLDELGIRYRISHYPMNDWRVYEIVPNKAVFINDFDALAQRFLDRNNQP